MWWPSHTKFLDFELELACVLAKPIADATPEEALDAVGGWFVLNDWSARDVQADDARRNVFGPVVKAKTFANSIGCDVLTADALPDWTQATGRVRVDGEELVRGHDRRTRSTALGAMLAYACAGEKLDAGDVISTGTMPGCCGLELDRWIRPGQTVELEIDGIGTLTNTISPTAVPGLMAIRRRRSAGSGRSGSFWRCCSATTASTSWPSTATHESYPLPRAAVIDDEVLRIFQSVGPRRGGPGRRAGPAAARAS